MKNFKDYGSMTRLHFIHEDRKNPRIVNTARQIQILSDHRPLLAIFAVLSSFVVGIIANFFLIMRFLHTLFSGWLMYFVMH